MRERKRRSKNSLTRLMPAITDILKKSITFTEKERV